jgi:hypothetical protein
MSQPLTTRESVALASSVYEDLLRTVVNGGVYAPAERDAGGSILPEGKRREITAGRATDIRAPFLCTISGKGGWHPVQAEKAKRASYTNVTLLDHLTSVARGALVFAALDLVTALPTLDPKQLRQRLAVIAAVAFLHDLDKILERPRAADLTVADVDGALVRFRVDRFLADAGVTLAGADMLPLIQKAEVTRGGHLRPGQAPPPRERLLDCQSVRLADRVDGIFLDTARGAAAAVEQIGGFAGLRTDTLARGWRTIRIADPHTPFLLDEILAGLSVACTEHWGFPPLVEMHHDGILLAVVPEENADTLVDHALVAAAARLGATIRPNRTERGTVDLRDAPGSLVTLRAAFEMMPPARRTAFLFCQADVMGNFAARLDGLLAPLGLAPDWGMLGQLRPMWTARSYTDDVLKPFLLDAQTLAVLLCCVDAPQTLGIPSVEQREVELRAALGDRLPAWLDEVPARQAQSRRMILAVTAAALAQEDGELHEALLGPGGQAVLWLEGTENRPGLEAKIDRSNLRLSEALQRHYRALLAGRRVAPANEAAEGRCHFTDQPTPITAAVSGQLGLYGVKVSAFSGRSGRPEPFDRVQPRTLVSPVAEAEHRLRQTVHQQSGRGKGGDLPAFISSPTTVGLFGALVHAGDQELATASLLDLLREKNGGDKPALVETELQRVRLRVARYEVIPLRLIGKDREFGQIDFADVVLRAALRLGRPIHVFRGLPRPEPAFVHFDFLPPALEMFLGGRSFRVEQLRPTAIRLGNLAAVAKATGFGADLAMAMADPRTRFGAACDTLARIARHDDDPQAARIRAFAQQLAQEPRKMSETDAALVAYAEACARVQQVPRRDDGAGVAETCLREALDAVGAARSLGQTSRASLLAAVAGMLERTLARRNLIAAAVAREKQPLSEALVTAAEIFVDQVWLGAFAGQAPASRNRRVAFAIYAFAFERRALELFRQRPATQERENQTPMEVTR